MSVCVSVCLCLSGYMSAVVSASACPSVPQSNSGQYEMILRDFRSFFPSGITCMCPQMCVLYDTVSVVGRDGWS